MDKHQDLTDTRRGDAMEKPKMDWMYQGVSGLVDREDYLLGRKVDKTFDVIKAAEDGETTTAERGEGLPSQLFKRKQADTPYVPVDMITKVREDPLYLIKKQEYNSKKQLLSNPIKMRMLQDMISKQQEGHKKSKKSKKSRKRSTDEDDIDAKLLKYKEKLLSNLPPTENSGKLEDIHHGQRRDQRRNSSRHDDSLRRSPSHRDDRKHKRSPRRDEYKGRSRHRSIGDFESGDSGRRRRETELNRKYDSKEDSGSESRKSSKKRLDEHSVRTGDIPSSETKRHDYGLIKMTKDANPIEQSVKKDYRKILDERKRKEERERQELEESLRNRRSSKMTQEEKEKRLQQMQQDAVEREKQRLDYVKRHKKADAIDVEGYKEGAFRGAEMLSNAVDSSTVERRVKSNLKNVQRSSKAMETNFLRK